MGEGRRALRLAAGRAGERGRPADGGGLHRRPPPPRATVENQDARRGRGGRMSGIGKPGIVFWWYTSGNPSPRVTPAFLERQRRLLLPAQFAREHQNAWVDAADAFTSAAEI